MNSLDEPARIEFLLLANHVEAVNGLLYISGGGWTDHRRFIRPDAPMPPTRIAIGLSVAIPWTETNKLHRVDVHIEDQDATWHIPIFDAQFNVGRPPTLPPGELQHQALAMATELVFPRSGSYRVVARLDGDVDVKTWSFRLHDMPAPPLPPPPPSPRP